MGARTKWCVPAKRLSAVFVAGSSFEHEDMRFVRRVTYRFLHLPELSSMVMRVNSVVTQLVTVGVLACRSNGVRWVTVCVQLCYGSEVRYNGGLFLAAGRLYRATCVIECGRTVLPNYNFHVNAACLGEVRKDFPIPVRPLKTRRFYVAVGGVSVILKALGVLLVGVVLARFLDRAYGAPIVVNGLRRAESKLFLCVEEGGTVLGVMVDSLFILFEEGCRDFRHLFHIGSSGALRVDVYCGKRYVVAGRDSHLSNEGQPSEGFAQEFMGIRGKVCRVVSRDYVGRDRRQVPYARDVPGQGYEVLRFTF